MGIFDELNELHSAQVAYETEPEELDPDWVLTVAELREYEELHGKAGAATLLLLVGVDGFEGDYEAMMHELCGDS